MTEITAPDGSKTREYLHNEGSSVLALALKGRSYKTELPDGSTTERLWQQNAPGGNSGVAGNPFVKTEFSSVADPAGNPVLTAIKDYTVDKNGNTTSVKVYDYVPYDSVPRVGGKVTGLPDASILNPRLKSIAEADYCNPTIDSIDTTTNSPNAYWNGSSPAIKSAPQSVEVMDPNGQVLSRTETFYDASSTLGAIFQGNPTLAKTWDVGTNTAISVATQFNSYGAVRKVWEPNENPATSSRFVETEYDSSHLFPVIVRTPAPDPTGVHGSAEGSQVTTAFDFDTGLVTSVTNEFGQTTATEYDTWLRPFRTYAANFTAPESQTIYGVPDANGRLPADQRFVKVRKQIDGTNWDEAISWSDALGRTIKTQAKDSQGDVFGETHYDNMGRVDRVTSPYRIGDTVLWSKTRYDIAGRAVESYAPTELANLGSAQSLGVTSFDISTVPNFIGTVVTTTDASGRKGRSITNAFGQLLRVDEPTAAGGSANADLGALATPYQPTIYKYSPQGKMVHVQQGVQGEPAIQNRYFLYDALGRLIRVRQPEQETNTALNLSDPVTGNSQWTAGFTYDILGNVITATDANGVTIHNEYDLAGRVKIRTYSGETGPQTPAVGFYYDGKGLGGEQSPNFAKGKLTKVTSSVSETRYKLFDYFGRLTEMEQRTPVGMETVTTAVPRVSKYTYNFSGALIEEEYPSGRKVKNEFESDGDLLNVTSKKTGSQVYVPYVSNFSYAASGGISQMRLGNGKWETAKFNNRLQVTELGLGSSSSDAGLWKVNYDYGELSTDGTSVDALKNTGNIARQTLTVPAASFVQTYRYDSLYRLTEAKEPNGTPTPNWIQNWNYDRYGNRTGFTQNIAGITDAPNPAIDPNTNRFTDLQAFGYDKNGNIIRDVGADNKTRSFLFNADNKQTEIRDVNIPTSPTNPDANLIGRYFYDGEGKRVKKVTPTETTVFVYSVGKLVAEYSTVVASSENAKIAYLTTDHLGSPRIITDQLGQVKARRDFLPFGEDIFANVGNRSASSGYGSSADNVRQKFTGYQKDNETSLDFAEARMYENRHGRFTAVDPLLASGKSANPQTFNRYVYTSNNPVVRVDRNGKEWIVERSRGYLRPTWVDPDDYDGQELWTKMLYFSQESRLWFALDANSGESRRFASFDRAYWQHGLYTDFNGSFDGIFDGNVSFRGLVNDGIAARDLAYLVGNIKTGNIDGALGTFARISAVNGAAAGIGNYFVKFLEKAVGSTAANSFIARVGSQELVPKGTRSLGIWGETRLAQVLGGTAEKNTARIATSLGDRVPDFIVDGIAHEAKAGLNVGLKSSIRKQILKDVELIDRGKIDGAHWHFFQGAQQEVLDFLTQNGIKYTVH